MSVPRKLVRVCLVPLLLPILAGCNASGSSGPTTYTTPPAETYTAHTFDLAPDESSEVSKTEGAQVSAGFFGATGAQTMLGRTTTPADFVVGSVRPIAILSHDLWTRRFGADPTIIGRTILLDGRPAAVVGVMPKGFSVPPGASVWTTR
jgi:hypothetical protein